MNHICFLSLIMIGDFALADEIRIKTTFGENASTFTVRPVNSDHVLSLESNQVGRRQVKIGKKNYEFVLRSSHQVIRLAQEANSKSAKSNCERDLSVVTILSPKEKESSAQVCLLANVPSSKELRSLLNVLLMEI